MRRVVVLDALVAFLAGVIGRLVPETGPLSASAGIPWPVFILPIVWLGSMLVARAYEHALTVLGPRPRSEREVPDRLGKHG